LSFFLQTGLSYSKVKLKLDVRDILIYSFLE